MKFVTVAAGAVVAVFGAVTAYKTFVEDSTACSISGTVFHTFSRQPVAGVELGYDAVSPSAPSQSPSFQSIAVSGLDGAFSGSCRGVGGPSFVILYRGGQFRDTPLPCLAVRSTNRVVSASDETTALNIGIPGC